MKELTIEQKAQRYDEALKVLHKYDGANIMFTQDLKEEMFPELKESKETEDERIRKHLISLFEKFVTLGVANECETSEIKVDDILAWLEKQGKNNMGISEATKQELEDNLNKALEKETLESWNEFLDEQKPTDKVEPKFHEGEWVVNTVGDTNQVVKVLDDGYTLDDNTFLSNSWATEHYHLWTIQDAKLGDVLATQDHILIFKKLLPKDGGVSYCHYDFGCSTPQFDFNKDDNWYFGKGAKVYPATKEQRDTLMKAMADAGYEWDAEKKELKKIEQNPTNEVGNYNHKEVLQTIINEQKPLWGEEDKKMLDFAIRAVGLCRQYAINNQVNGYSKLPDVPKRYEELRNWLKSLKDRYTWKPSDEQMKALEYYLRNVIDKEGIFGRKMVELYEDLWNLREE